MVAIAMASHLVVSMSALATISFLLSWIKLPSFFDRSPFGIREEFFL
jgi:hypothetical protein